MSHSDLLCPLLHKVFGDIIKCISTERTFTGLSLLSERFASSAAYQYHSELLSLKNLITYIQQKVCNGDQFCIFKVDRLRHANYFDLDFDAISQSVVLTAFWDKSPDAEYWDENITNIHGSFEAEIGVLANEKSTQLEEISLGGFLVVLGEGDQPSMSCSLLICDHVLKMSGPTLFAFPSRHHLANANFSATFVHPTGLHPVLRIEVPRNSLLPPAPACVLHTYLTIPSFLFVDQYQLSAPNYLASKNIRSIRSLSGETDLEAPDWTVSKWGSALLLELAPPVIEKGSPIVDPWHAEIPLHLRYVRSQGAPRTSHGPKTEGSAAHKALSLPWPNVFWACPTDEGTKMNTNPFDRVNLGYDGLFGSRTMFYHLQSATHQKLLVEELEAPIMDLTATRGIELGTLSFVILGFMWAVWRLLRQVQSDFVSRTNSQQKKQD